MKTAIACLIIALSALPLSTALPTSEEASAAALVRRCHTESNGDNGGTTYTTGDCSGYTFSGTNVVNLDNANSSAVMTPKRDCNTQTIGGTTYTSGDCSGSTYSGNVANMDASNSSAAGSGMPKRDGNGFPYNVEPPECQAAFNGWTSWCYVRSSPPPFAPLHSVPMLLFQQILH